jgi:hypothetical protein
MVDSINDRRDLLNQYVADQYYDLKNGQITHLDLLANSVDFAVSNVKFSESAYYHDDYSGSYDTGEKKGDATLCFGERKKGTLPFVFIFVDLLRPTLWLIMQIAAAEAFYFLEKRGRYPLFSFLLIFLGLPCGL